MHTLQISSSVIGFVTLRDGALCSIVQFCLKERQASADASLLTQHTGFQMIPPGSPAGRGCFEEPVIFLRSKVP